ncbi:hypothetical protein X740_33460 [Mesorhizobium sp. LNHC221B00]|nr:hypothetical protein X740_33460 [Mesorhizobium sp. LNHC221B00]
MADAKSSPSFCIALFGLPKTQFRRHAAAEYDDHLAFLLWRLSSFLGTRLTATKAGLFMQHPFLAGKLVDFGMSGANIAKTPAAR